MVRKQTGKDNCISINCISDDNLFLLIVMSVYLQVSLCMIHTTYMYIHIFIQINIYISICLIYIFPYQNVNYFVLYIL